MMRDETHRHILTFHGHERRMRDKRNCWRKREI